VVQAPCINGLAQYEAGVVSLVSSEILFVTSETFEIVLLFMMCGCCQSY
jgi:hypothetical protein